MSSHSVSLLGQTSTVDASQKFIRRGRCSSTSELQFRDCLDASYGSKFRNRSQRETIANLPATARDLRLNRESIHFLPRISLTTSDMCHRNITHIQSQHRLKSSCKFDLKIGASPVYRGTVMSCSILLVDCSTSCLVSAMRPVSSESHHSYCRSRTASVPVIFSSGQIRRSQFANIITVDLTVSPSRISLQLLSAALTTIWFTARECELIPQRCVRLMSNERYSRTYFER